MKKNKNKRLIIAIIPARGGSTRLPNKNIRKIEGKPAIAWTIIKLKKIKLFDEIYVSTDSKKIASIALKYGAKVPFYRSKKLSNNFTSTQKVVSNMIKFLIKQGLNLGSVCCIYPTAFNFYKKDIILGFKKLEKNFNFVIAVSKYEKPPQRSFFIKKNQTIKMLMPSFFKFRSQELKPVYFDIGQFYWARANVWIKKKLNFDNYCTSVHVPNWRAQDIDTKEDWIKAKKIFEKINKNEKKN